MFFPHIKKTVLVLVLLSLGVSLSGEQALTGPELVELQIREEIRERRDLDAWALGLSLSGLSLGGVGVLCYGLSSYFYKEYQETTFSDQAMSYRSAVEIMDALWIASFSAAGALVISGIGCAASGPDRAEIEYLEGLPNEE